MVLFFSFFLNTLAYISKKWPESQPQRKRIANSTANSQNPSASSFGDRNGPVKELLPSTKTESENDTVIHDNVQRHPLQELRVNSKYISKFAPVPPQLKSTNGIN